MMPYQLIAGGSFTAGTTNKETVQVPCEPDFIWVRNRTSWGDDAACTSVEANWFRGMAQGAAQTVDQAVTTGALSSEAVTTGGFRVYNTAEPPTYAALACTNISTANPAVCTMADTGSIVPGDIVRVTSPEDMYQIGGYDFSVTAVTTNTNITLNFDSQNEAAVADNANIRLLIPGRFYPRWRYIVPLGGAAGITQAAQCVVSCSVAHNFSVGEVVTFRVPSQFGMDEINNLQGIVQAVTTYTVTVDIDTTGFTAFAMPTSAQALAGLSPAIIMPAGAGPYPSANPPYVPTAAAFSNQNQWLIEMGPNVITVDSEVYDWRAYKYDLYNGN